MKEGGGLREVKEGGGLREVKEGGGLREAPPPNKSSSLYFRKKVISLIGMSERQGSTCMTQACQRESTLMSVQPRQMWIKYNKPTLIN